MRAACVPNIGVPLVLGREQCLTRMSHLGRRRLLISVCEWIEVVDYAQIILLNSLVAPVRLACSVS